MLVVLLTGNLDVGVTVTLGCMELGILLESDTRVLCVTVCVLSVEFTGMLNSVFNVLSVSTGVLKGLGDAGLEKLDILVTLWIVELVGMTVVEVGITVPEVGITVPDVGSTVAEVGNAVENVEFLSIREELETRALELGETVAFVLNTVVEFCSILLDIPIPLVLNAVADFKVDTTKLELNKGMVVEKLTSVVEITVVFAVNISVVSSVLDLKVLLLSVKTKLLEFSTLLCMSVTGLENVMLVFDTPTKLVMFGSAMVEETNTVLLLGGTNEDVSVKRLLDLGTMVEFTTRAVDETAGREEDKMVS